MNTQIFMKYINGIDLANGNLKISYIIFDRLSNEVMIMIEYGKNKDLHIKIKAIMKYTILEGGKWYPYFKSLKAKSGCEIDSITILSIKNKLKEICDPLVTLLYKEVIRRKT